MDKPKLLYSDLLPEKIKKFHQENGGVLVELNPIQGKMLLSLLDQRTRVEQDLLFGANALRLIWDNCVWSFYEMKARFFNKKLLTLQQYVKAVDATHGWEGTREGSQIFMLYPIKKAARTGIDPSTSTQ